MKIYSTGYINGQRIFENFTDQLGQFSPTVLIYFSGLRELDVSGCTQIDSNLFTDCIVACVNLLKLVMVRCIQFTQYQVLKFVRNLPELKYFDVSKGPEFTYTNGYVMLCSLKNLEMVDFEPKNISIEIADWKALFRMFAKVHFGLSITRYFPHNGCGLRSLRCADE